MNDVPNKVMFKGSPDERITVEHFIQRFSDKKPVFVEKHSHDFFELVFVKNGLCEHTFRDTRVTLMSNDVLLVMPDQVHEFTFSEQIDIYNCQFYADELHGIFLDIVNNLSFPNLRTSAIEFNSIESENKLILSKEKPTEKNESNRFSTLNMQGIIHLSYSQAHYLENLFEKIISEQATRSLRFAYIVKNCLEEALIIIERIMTDQFKIDDDIPQKHKAIVKNVLNYIDANYQEHLNFNDIASTQDLSPNYFRKIFKSYTGTSPVDHLNRIRVLKALELLRDHKNLSSGEVAEQVGIYDANYFTRLFKKYIGYPPSHFAKKG